MPGSNLPADEVEMERAIANAIRSVLLTVPHIGHVYVIPRHPSKDDELKMTQVDDPVVGADRQITNVVEIGIPTVGEDLYSGDDEVTTELTLNYPMTYSLGIVDEWNKDGFPYHSSGEMFVGIYMHARRKFKADRTLGFRVGVLHTYLQQERVDELVNDTGEALEHLADWSLEVHVKGNW